MLFRSVVALREAQRISSHEARRRQLQYIGKLMRGLDAEPIRAALAEHEGHSAAARVRQRQLEQWRERLIAEGLTDPDRKPPLPRFPRRVGLVTGRDSRMPAISLNDS